MISSLRRTRVTRTIPTLNVQYYCTYILGLCNMLGLRTRRPPFTRASHTPYYTMTRIRELLHFHGLFKIYFIAEDFFFLQLLVFFLVIMQLLVLCKHLQCNFFYWILWFSKLCQIDFELFLNSFYDFLSATFAWTRRGISVTNLVLCLKEKQWR